MLGSTLLGSGDPSADPERRGRSHDRLHNALRARHVHKAPDCGAAPSMGRDFWSVAIPSFLVLLLLASTFGPLPQPQGRAASGSSIPRTGDTANAAPLEVLRGSSP